MDQTSLSAPAILLLNVVLCTVIAVLLWLLVPAIGRFGFWPVFVHSQSIGFSISVFTILGFRLTGQAHNQQTWIRPALVTAGTAIGLSVGLLIAQWLLGIPGITRGREELLAILITAIIASTGFNWYLASRERVTRLELAASEAQRSADNTRHALLRAQVEPHMLFNTLANLRALIQTDQHRAIEMLDKLDAFMRATLQSSRRTSSRLFEEFQLLRDYLDIMQTRLGDRLQVELTLPGNCRDIAVPALILQPLVENAIKHGIEPSVDGGRIVVSATREETALLLAVSNTGAEYSPEPKHNDGGFGLANLKERLTQAYDGRASLQINAGANTPPGLTVVQIRLPLGSSFGEPQPGAATETSGVTG